MEENLPVQSDSAGLVTRAKGMILSPKAEWPKVAAETSEPKQVLLGYALPLAAIGPIASLIGMQVFGLNLVFTTVRPSLGTSITSAVVSFVLSLVGLFVLAWVANFVSPKFGGRDSYASAFKLVAYSMTAAWIAGIFGLVPSLGLIGALLGLYSLYLLYLGATPVMGVPADKAVGYTVVTIVAAIVLYIVVGAITSAVVGSMIVSAAPIANIQ